MSFAAKALSHRTLRRRHLIAHILIGLTIIWGLLWAVTSYHFNKKLDMWVETQKAVGWTITFQEHYTNGNPFSVHVHFNGLEILSPHGAMMRAKESVLYMNLWDWHDIDIKLRKSVRLALSQMTIQAETIKMGIALPKTKGSVHENVGLAFWVQPFGIKLPNTLSLPIGSVIEEAYFDMRFMGPLPDISDEGSLHAWAEMGGVIEFDQFYLRTNSLTLMAAGTMGLDQSLQPQGAFSCRIDGLNAMMSTMISNGSIDKQQETMLHYSLKVLSRPSGLISGSAPIIPLAVQNQGLYLGPVKIWTIPEIQW